MSSLTNLSVRLMTGASCELTLLTIEVRVRVTVITHQFGLSLLTKPSSCFRRKVRAKEVRVGVRLK